MLEVGIYIHIPFCINKCYYCDFISFPYNEKSIKKYIKALKKEIKYKQEVKNHHIDTIFLGGGTPSLLSANLLEEIIISLNKHFIFNKNLEITIEANPGTINKKSLDCWRIFGINRISFGVQSFQNKILKKIGRIHNASKSLKGIKQALEAGFDNINIDLLSGLPCQTDTLLTSSILTAIRNDINHISLYSLNVEKNSLFGRRLEIGDLDLPSEEEEDLMYDSAIYLLEKNGFIRYEISNFAKKGYECKHNLKYWQRKDYLGFGVSAASLYNSIRTINTSCLYQYINDINTNNEKNIIINKEFIDNNKAMSEFMFLGLRMNKGISTQEFKEIFSIDIDKHFKKGINRGIKNGWLIKKENRFCLTPKGIKFSNILFREFI